MSETEREEQEVRKKREEREMWVQRKRIRADEGGERQNKREKGEGRKNRCADNSDVNKRCYHRLHC